MFNLFFFLLLIAFIYTSYKKTILGLAWVIVLLPSYLWRFNILGLPTTFLELMILSLFAIWLIKEKRYKRINFSLSKENKNKIPYFLRWLLLAWLLVSVLSFLANPLYSSLGLWRSYFLEPIMFFLVFIYTVKEKKDLQIIFNSLIVLSSWLLVVALYQNFTNWNFIYAYNPPNPKRLTALFSYPNALSLLTAPLSGLFFGLWAYSKDKIYNWHYLLAFVFCFALSIFAQSQGAILAIIFSLFIWLIFAKKIKKIGLPVVGLALIFVFLYLPVNNYFRQITDPGKGLSISSLEIRSWQWQETMDMLAENPILGAGLNGYQKVISDYHKIDWIEIYLYPHNIFLNFWSELGLFGLLVFLSLLFYIFLSLKKIFKAKETLAWPLTLAWVVWFVHGLVDVPYFKNDLSVLFFLMLAMTILIKENAHNRKK